eukprot:TRINITY_DN32665_c0_g1_i1.p2 TRINITY_DN32665_c0_g1~~TRINITY_DN32665_c0_g1_i1.p2  ORF type:complete len:123 (+),score=9.60 TRINITY_DN32665_c0_g1_i1:66-434(+)
MSPSSISSAAVGYIDSSQWHIAPMLPDLALAASSADLVTLVNKNHLRKLMPVLGIPSVKKLSQDATLHVIVLVSSIGPRRNTNCYCPAQANKIHKLSQPTSITLQRIRRQSQCLRDTLPRFR